MQAIDYLNNLDKFGVKPGLERIKLLLDYFDNPQQELDVIQVAGTNGKGSTSALLTNIYKAAGYQVGTYNSPHIVDFKERIRVNDVNISATSLDSLVEEMKPAINKVASELEHPTFFEVLTALAILYFARQEVDLVILEAGMGGRWDATNVVDSLVSVITNVSLDHTAYLGETISEIAWEKAGIINSHQVVITATSKQEVLSVVEKICQERDSKLLNINQEFKWQQEAQNLAYQVFSASSSEQEYSALQLPLLGEHQVVNSTLALAVVEELQTRLAVTKEELKQGISQVSCPGRLEVVAQQPTIILDGAHNQSAARKLKNNLADLNYDNLFLVLSILADKDILGIVKQLAPLAQEIIVTENNNYRVADITNIKEKVIPYNFNVKSKPELQQALNYTQQIVTESDLILVSGSLYTVAEARQILN
ncbi:bifunctional folylpolyglutamate synthase/dihydrofolate synthase [Halanaerobaculum tunisiense]